MDALLFDRLALAQRKRFGSSSEKYADGSEWLELFDETEVSADLETEEVTVTGCLTHARCRFDVALTVLKKDFTKEQRKYMGERDKAEFGQINVFADI